VTLEKEAYPGRLDKADDPVTLEDEALIFAVAANTSIFPFWYLAFKHNQVSS